MQRIALVTGASSGVGEEFVRQLDAGKGGPLDAIWVVARTKERLDELAERCEHVPIRVLAYDLMQQAAFDELEQLLNEEDVVVEWLINSAGFGTFGTYDEIGMQANANMVRLNCLAVVNMTSLVLPHMHAGSRIVNLASIAGAIPQVMLATYSATKAFVLELSRMLDHELRPCGIRVTAVCPKFMRTRFLSNPGNAPAAEGMCRIGFESVERVVSRALCNALFGRSLCIPSLDMKLAYAASCVIPRGLLYKVEDLLFRTL